MSVGDWQFVHFISVKYHGTDGGAGYATNYSAIAYMDGYFNQFTISPVTWSSTSNFGMGGRVTNNDTFLMHSTLSDATHENMFSDPGFEDEASNPAYGVSAPWIPAVMGGASIDRGAGTAHSGVDNARLTATDRSEQTFGQMVAVKRFTTYRATAGVCSSAGLQFGNLSLRDSTGYPAALIAATPVDATEPASPQGQQISLAFASGGPTHLAFVVGFTGDGANDSLLIDDASLIQQ